MKTSYYFGAMALGLLFAACSSDKLDEQAGNGVSGENRTLYVNLSIHGDSPSTRTSASNGTPTGAEDFDEGDASENGVDNAYFVFYDEDGQVVGDLVPVTLSNPSTSTSEDGSINRFYKSVVPVSVRKGEKNPTGVICYINPISPSSLQNPLSVIQTVNRERVATTIGTTRYFAMSNSVYYPDQTPGTEPQVVVPVQEGQLFKTEADAMAAEGGLVVDVYVERYASKLTFQAEGEGQNIPYVTGTRVYGATEADPTTDNSVVLTFNPEYWALNAQCNTGYVVKSFRREAADGQIMANNYTYGLLNSRINIADPSATVDYSSDALSPTMTSGAWAWNSVGNHRSYWSMSPAYFQTEYPEVASDVEKIDMPNQDYLTYNMLEKVNPSTNTTYGYKKGDPAFTAPHYYKETTVGINAINSKNPAAAVASVIYVGKYSLSVNGTAVEGNPSFYTYLKGNVTVDGKVEQRPFVYFENNDLGESTVAGGESMLKRFCAQSTILFTRNADGTYVELGLNNYGTFVDALQVAEITDAVKNVEVAGMEKNKGLKLQANARSLQFKSVAAAAGIYIASGNGYKSIVADNAENITNDQITITQANAILMQQVGYAYYYKNGLAYFNIPVKHLGWYRQGNENRTLKDGVYVDNPTINWNVVRVGDFGMVRNHTYNVVVDKITGLAPGIAGEDTPIVPPASSEDYFVSYRVNILNWAVVPTQHVNL